MANLTNDLINKANGAATEFKNKVQSGELQLDKMAHNVGERAGEMASEFAQTASDTMKTGRDYVKENPVKGVAIAAAVGVVAGSLLTMIMGRRKE